MPERGTGEAIILGQDLEIEHVDVAIVIEVGGGRCGSVLAHANGQGIELVDQVVAVDIAGDQVDGGHGG